MRLLWLPHVLRLAGVSVVEMSGWEARGRELDAVHGVVWHHTASSVRTTDASMERMLVTGRPDLVGPLSQLGLRRDGTWVVVASGRANHNGYGTWGNSSIGIEAYNDGVGEPWPTVQVESYVNGTAAILRHLGLNTASVKGHKETDPRRKIDPAGLDMNLMRARIAQRLTYVPPAPKPTPTPTSKELTMSEAKEINGRLDVLAQWTKDEVRKTNGRLDILVQWSIDKFGATAEDIAELELRLKDLER